MCHNQSSSFNLPVIQTLFFLHFRVICMLPRFWHAKRLFALAYGSEQTRPLLTSINENEICRPWRTYRDDPRLASHFPHTPKTIPGRARNEKIRCSHVTSII